MLKKSAGVKPSNIHLSAFEAYFKSVNNPNDQFFTPDEDVLHFMERYENNEFKCMFHELNNVISQNEILNAVSHLKTNKSGGPDYLINEFFIHGKNVLLPILEQLFNKIFTLGYFPNEWSEGFIIPLHKKGSIEEVTNYRGITLLSTLGKLFTRILNTRLTEWAENYNVYVEAQAGFRAEMGTTDNIFVLHGLINNYLNAGKQLYCAFIDFSKAFDYVVRDNLWLKMIKLGLRGNIFNIIKSIYMSVKSRIKHNNKLSEGFDCSLGVRQGECLSPFLFAMFLNDLEDMFINSGLPGIDVNMFKIFLILYADDIIIFGNNAEELQCNLDLLHDYCERWKLKVNTAKTKIMIFRKGGRLPQNLMFIYNNNQLEIVSKFTYLGIVFTPGGSFSEAQLTLAGQALKAMFNMNKYLHKFTNISVVHRLELFDKLVAPILNYGSEVWGFIEGAAIERAHMQFCKRILGVKKATQNDFIYGELGRISFKNIRFYNILRYWIKVVQCTENKYVSKIYHMMKNDSDQRPGLTNWCSLVKRLLCNLGLHYAWLSQSVGNKQAFLSLAKQRIKDQFVQNWSNRLNDSSRALFYNSIRVFQMQPYFLQVNLQKFRIALSQLRVSSHRLQIEAGRWHRPEPMPIPDRKCIMCNKIEDEYHFILECPLYAQIRARLIPTYFVRRPSMFKLTELLQSNDSRINKNLSSFIYKAFEIRKHIMYN